MKVVQVHNYYQFAGGEDAVVAAERDALTNAGHVVIPFYKDNKGIEAAGSTCALARVAVQTIWNHAVYREMRALLRRERPDVVHCHNTFPLISPSVYWACHAERVPVLQTLHNYRLLCLNGYLFRMHRDVSPVTGGACEKCLRKTWKWPGVRYACYRGSRSGSLTVMLMLMVHRVIGTWTRRVGSYAVMSSFQRDKLAAGGIPPDRMRVFTRAVDPVREEPLDRPCPSRYVLYVGRLSPEKGADILLRAWAKVDEPQRKNATLRIVGEGPERPALEALSRTLGIQDALQWLGARPPSEIRHWMKGALLLVSPSPCYETFGLVVREAAHEGLPALVSSPGAITEQVEEGVTGWLFPAHDADALAARLAWAIDHPEACAAMGTQARQRYEKTMDRIDMADELIRWYRSAEDNGMTGTTTDL
jgi:glycosyltransferase involved in cell wall biosynthesis